MLKTFFIGSLATAAICSAADKKPSPIITDDGKCIISKSTTTDHVAIVLYQKGEDGFLTNDTMVCITDSLVLSPDEISAFDTKNKKIIYSTDRGVFTATVKKDLSKPIESIKGLIKLKKDKDIEKMITDLSQALEARINEENNKHINNIKKQQAAQDSILKIQRHALKVEEFRNKHRNSWRTWKMKSGYKCDVCNKTHPEGSSVYLVKTTPSYWFYKMKSPGSTEWSSTLHSMKAPQQKENNAIFFEAFADSLKAISAKKNEPYYTVDAVRKKNELITNDAFRKSIPWGFVYNWGWDTDADGNVIFEATFLNASDSAIKEIYFYTSVTGPVKKQITPCLFRANTPVPPGDYGYWRWDSSDYNVDDSASSMSFSKIVIVYADGSKKTLSGNELKVFRK